MVPPLRVRNLNDLAVRPDGRYVLYWMTAARRTRSNFALDRAIDLARELDQPLIVLEALRVGYRWASDRFHRFVIDGMADNAQSFEGTGILYHPYVEPEAGAGDGLLEALADKASAVVTDDYPAFFLPRMAQAAAKKLQVRLESVDSNGILPMRAAKQVFARAYDFRRFLQRELAPHLTQTPRKEPLRTELRPKKRLPDGISKRWPRVDQTLLDGGIRLFSELPIDHGVAPVPYRGGPREGRKVLRSFLDERLGRYGEDRNQPENDAASGLSPYLHFGHVSAYEVLSELAKHEKWSPAEVTGIKSGKRSGWWGMSAAAESFLDELVTWRELGFNMCHQKTDYDRFESLPDWARATLEEHASDKRPHVYSLEDFENAKTHDDLWNAAQNQLRIEGRIHNYLRMLWGKKIFHWSESPRAALDILIELNNKYAVDGRDPNSYSGIFWVLGRYDRAWGPEREVFGKIRYMTSANTRRKLRVDKYIERWDEWQPTFAF